LSKNLRSIWRSNKLILLSSCNVLFFMSYNCTYTFSCFIFIFDKRRDFIEFFYWNFYWSCTLRSTHGVRHARQYRVGNDSLSVVIVSPIPCNHTAAIIERHCGCAPLYTKEHVLSSSTARIRVFLSHSRLLSHVLLSPSVSPSATRRNRLSNLASPVSLISCLVRCRNFCAHATKCSLATGSARNRDRKIRYRASNNEVFNQ